MVRFQEQENLFSEGPLEIRVSSVPVEEALLLLRKTVYGTAGVRYLHTGQEEKLRLISPALFFHVYLDGRLVGFFCLDPRVLSFPTGPVQGYYGRYFSIAESMQGRGFGKLLIDQASALSNERLQFPA